MCVCVPTPKEGAGPVGQVEAYKHSVKPGDKCMRQSLKGVIYGRLALRFCPTCSEHWMFWLILLFFSTLTAQNSNFFLFQDLLRFKSAQYR